MPEGREGRKMLLWIERPKFAASDTGRAGCLSSQGLSQMQTCLHAFVNRKQTRPIFLGLEEKLAPCVMGFCHSWKD